jgi:nitrite reductase/ring-hydroxylating ferredoxin subunit
VAAAPGVRKFVVARVEDIPEGGRLITELGGRRIGVFHEDGEFYALLYRCPHLGGPLCEGRIVGLVTAPQPGDIRFDPETRMLTCPWHGWEFDIKTGQSYWDPGRTRARRFPVEVAHGDEIVMHEAGAEGRVRGPYVAETFPVEVEEDYVVVAMRESPLRESPTDARP